VLSNLLLVSWIAGLLVPALATTLFFKSIDWTKQLDGPTWDFTKSWASNMTAAGTILSYSVLLSCIAPNAALYFFSRPSYLSIGAIALGLSVLAPLAFNVMSRILETWVPDSASPIAFLLSAGITVWGLTLQLFIGGCLVWELYKLNTLPQWAALALLAFVLLLSILVVWYAILTAADTLREETPPVVGARAHLQAELQAPQPTTWHLL
jgi:hypothetical protein